MPLRALSPDDVWTVWSVLGSAALEGHGHAGESPGKGWEDGGGIGASDIEGEAERAVIS